MKARLCDSQILLIQNLFSTPFSEETPDVAVGAFYGATPGFFAVWTFLPSPSKKFKKVRGDHPASFLAIIPNSKKLCYSKKYGC